MPGPRYATGEKIQLGDVVGLGDIFFGRIVYLIETGECCEDFPRHQWPDLGCGFVIQSADGALMMCEGAEDMTLVDRS